MTRRDDRLLLDPAVVKYANEVAFLYAQPLEDELNELRAKLAEVTEAKNAIELELTELVLEISRHHRDFIKWESMADRACQRAEQAKMAASIAISQRNMAQQGIEEVKRDRDTLKRLLLDLMDASQFLAEDPDEFWMMLGSVEEKLGQLTF